MIYCASFASRGLVTDTGTRAGFSVRCNAVCSAFCCALRRLLGVLIRGLCGVCERFAAQCGLDCGGDVYIPGRARGDVLRRLRRACLVARICHHVNYMADVLHGQRRSGRNLALHIAHGVLHIGVVRLQCLPEHALPGLVDLGLCLAAVQLSGKRRDVADRRHEHAAEERISHAFNGRKIRFLARVNQGLRPRLRDLCYDLFQTLRHQIEALAVENANDGRVVRQLGYQLVHDARIGIVERVPTEKLLRAGFQCAGDKAVCKRLLMAGPIAPGVGIRAAPGSRTERRKARNAECTSRSGIQEHIAHARHLLYDPLADTGVVLRRFLHSTGKLLPQNLRVPFMAAVGGAKLVGDLSHAGFQLSVRKRIRQVIQRPCRSLVRRILDARKRTLYAALPLLHTAIKQAGSEVAEEPPRRVENGIAPLVEFLPGNALLGKLLSVCFLLVTFGVVVGFQQTANSEICNARD